MRELLICVVPEVFKGLGRRQIDSRRGWFGLMGKIGRTARIWTDVEACRKGKEGDWMKELKGGKELDS